MPRRTGPSPSSPPRPVGGSPWPCRRGLVPGRPAAWSGSTRRGRPRERAQADAGPRLRRLPDPTGHRSHRAGRCRAEPARAGEPKPIARTDGGRARRLRPRRSGSSDLIERSSGHEGLLHVGLAAGPTRSYRCPVAGQRRPFRNPNGRAGIFHRGDVRAAGHLRNPTAYSTRPNCTPSRGFGRPGCVGRPGHVAQPRSGAGHRRPRW